MVPQHFLSLSQELAATMKAGVARRIADPADASYSPGLRVDTVTCRSAGAQAFACVATYSDGTQEQVDVAAVAGGHTWTTG